MGGHFYITAAIDYSNGNPHIGHAFEKVGVDALARYRTLCGETVRVLVGTDEHSQNVAKKAAEAGVTPKHYCDKMAEIFQNAYNFLQVKYSRFIRTSDPDHHAMVKWISQKVFDKGDITKGFYEGYYCVSCEAYYQAKDLVEQKCPVHKREVTTLKEENYFFKLSKYRDALVNHIKKHPEFIQPEFRRNEILKFLEEPLQDISISRSKTEWGVPLPFDPSTVAYVWFDALTNYLTGVGPIDSALYQSFWPHTVHIVGKDISRFHTVIWPAMLMSAEVPLPKTVWVHGFVNLSGEKMSKTTGTVIDPLETAQKYGVYALRYFLMKEIPWNRDGDFAMSRLVEIHNADLANGIGNLLSRTTSMIHKSCGGTVASTGAYPDVDKMWTSLEAGLSRYHTAFSQFLIHEAAGQAVELVRALNLLIDQKKPWAMAKVPEQAQELSALLHVCLAGVALIGHLLTPIIPDKAAEIIAATQTPAPGPRLDGFLAGLRALKLSPELAKPLFPRLELS
jgi:methionyl-tRNA synthetase